jgi:two-component system, cell cycle sensor histidine kinase and response regulator CckA
MTTTADGARKITILLADDESAIALLFEMDLTRRGYRVLAAHSAAEATKLSTECPTPIDVLVSDWNMPDMKGDKLARQLLQERPEMKFVLMSGYANAADAINGFPKNQATFIPKPFTPSKLDSAIKELLSTVDPSPAQAA